MSLFHDYGLCVYLFEIIVGKRLALVYHGGLDEEDARDQGEEKGVYP